MFTLLIAKQWKNVKNNGNSKRVGEEVAKAKVLKEKYEAKFEFPEG